MAKETQVSIIMSVYNEEKTVAKAIRSVLDQTFRNFEFIIIDDGSTDSTYEILKKFTSKDKSIKIFKNTKNIGLTKSLNIGLKHSRSDFIARIDGNDWWEKEKLNLQVKFLETNPEYVIVGTNAINYNQITKKKTKSEKPKEDQEIRQFLFKGAPFVHSSVVFRKSKVNRYDEKYYTSQDYELYSRILKKGKGYNLQKLLTHRITHIEESITIKHLKLHKLNDIKIRWKIFKNYKASLEYYVYFIADILFLITPTRLKVWKQKLKKLFNN